jgi:NADPH2:quinone reductase
MLRDMFANHQSAFREGEQNVMSGRQSVILAFFLIARAGWAWDDFCMKAYGVLGHEPLGNISCLEEFEIDVPIPSANELLVEVRAISVNPVDAKVRASLTQPMPAARILGWDASGIVRAVGSEVTGFQPGDEVYYAGDITRAGCNAEFQCVDECLVALKPSNLDFAQAASLPLTSLTAWEGMVERMRMKPGQRILIIGGAGGVGSMAIQIAKMMGLHVTATASREASRQWCLQMGTDALLDHSVDLATQCREMDLPMFDGIANFSNTERYWDFMGEWIAPMGHLLLIVEPRTLLHVGDPLKAKCVSIHWEFMFSRSKFSTPCRAEQGQILQRIAKLVEQGQLRHTMAKAAQRLNLSSLREAHALMESASAIGKHVLFF